jgi:hypothetical protein
MGDGNVKEEGDPIQGETKIWALTIFGAGLRNRVQASVAKKRNKKLQEDGVARGDRPAHEMPANHKMVGKKLTTARATGTKCGGGGGR